MCHRKTSGARMAVLLVPALLLGVPVGAQAPDCDGVSTVFNNDPDLVGELVAVRVVRLFNTVVQTASAPGDNSRLFLVQQIGLIRVQENGELLTTPFLDLRPVGGNHSEEGLLGMAFHPDYQQNGYFFVYYTDTAGDQQIVRYQRLTPNVADPASATTVLTVPHPGNGNHNGGKIAFGPHDGKLYIGTGDGGNGCDPGPDPGNGQTLTSPLGKILRLDVDSLPPSTAGNPYDGGDPADDAVWAYGLRNPWRWSFDRETGAMYLGDVGQLIWEEVNCAPAGSTGGENYGWVNMEGNHCPNASCPPQDPCPPPGHVPPIVEYTQEPPCAVIGGFVYRGCRMPDLRGTYFYSDFCDAFVNTFRTDGSCAVGPPEINREDDLEPGAPFSVNSIVGFGEDNQGELYITELSGEVYKILPELSIMELSGVGAVPLVVAPDGSIVWEDLVASSSHPVTEYRVYRSVGDPAGTFTCVHSSSESSWAGGDPTSPGAGQVAFYLVTARNDGGQETLPGFGSGGISRVLDTVSPCAP